MFRSLSLCLALLLALGSTLVQAQNRNPAYDEWLRKQATNDSLRATGANIPDDNDLSNDAFDLTAGVGVMTVLSGVNYNAKGLNDAKGAITTYGVGYFGCISLGNMYSPQLGSEKSGILYGVTVKVGTTTGSGRIDSYTRGSDGISGSYGSEDLTNLSSQEGYSFSSESFLISSSFHLGWKFKIENNVSIGLHGGVGLAATSTEFNVNYISVDNMGIRRSYNPYGSGIGLGLTAQAEGYVSLYSFFYAAVGLDASAVGSILSNSTAANPLAARVQVGLRIPFLNFGSSLRALQ